MIKKELCPQTGLEIDRKEGGQITLITWDSNEKELSIERIYGEAYPSRFGRFDVRVIRTYKLNRHASLFFEAINKTIDDYDFTINLLQYGFEAYY